jgi:integrase
VDNLTPQHFADMLRPVWLDIQPTAAKVKQRCHAVMAAQYAIGHTRANPVDVVDLLLPKQASTAGHHPAMPWQEVPAFVQQYLTRQPILGSRAALMFLILTAGRSNEIRGATWDEIDLDARLWTVPKERMKALRPHRVPLSAEAVELLRQQQGQHKTLVFPSLKGKKLSDMALSSLLRRAKAPSDTPDHTATAHGFRASFRNWAADCGYSNDVAERSLAHTINNKVQAAYERTDRLEARTRMMEQWADYCRHGAPASATVVHLPSRPA